MGVEVGDQAPDFTLPSDNWDNKISLQDQIRQGPVALFFYPGDWSSVCTDQMSRIQSEIGRFEELGARVLAVSADTPWSHKAFAEDRGIEFPLLSDFERDVISEYGVKHEGGFPKRAYFIVDQEGTVRARRIESTPKEQPDVDEVLEDLKKAL